MSGVIACGQASILGESCPSCGGWLHVERKWGYLNDGWRYCSEDCIADQQEYESDTHLRMRDMLCECAEVCAPLGLPTAADKAEWAAYLATPFEKRR